jgi:hypothetical protein
MIAQAEQVECYFGYWPEFSDGSITRFSYEDESVISLTICYIDTNQNKAAQVEFKFNGVSNIELSNLKSQNIIDVLCISQDQLVKVELEACYGLFGSFNCRSVEVASMRETQCT